MYVTYPKLSSDSLKTLEELVLEINWADTKAHRLRLGENGGANISQYKTTRWFEWTAEQRARFRSALPDTHCKSALVGYFLGFEPKTGFLDRITTWEGDAANSGTIIAYALKDATILLNDVEIEVKRGEGIGFNLSVVHEVKASEEGQLWANVMVLGDPAKFQI